MVDTYDGLKIGDYVTHRYLEDTGAINSNSFGVLYNAQLTEKDAQDSDVVNSGATDTSAVYKLVETAIQDKSYSVNALDRVDETVNLYMYILNAEPSITVNTSINDATITVDSTTNVTIGDVITLYEGDRHYQSLITNIVGQVITLASPLDFAFTTDAKVHVGDWLLNIDGSVTTQKAIVIAPTDAKFKLRTLRVSILDSSDMDDGRFGGIPALANGILYRLSDSIIKDGPLITNNLGFFEQGFSTAYTDKAPAGQFGFKASMYLRDIFGTSLILAGNTDDMIELYIRDDLTGLDQFTCVVSGYRFTGV